jgi:transcription elongation GreA/GreB family factor
MVQFSNTPFLSIPFIGDSGMSRAFVKEPDGENFIEELPELRQSPNVNYVTPAGLRRLEARVAELGAARRALTGSEAPEDIQALRRIDRDLRYFEERLRRAVPVDPRAQPADEVGFGMRVTVETPEGRRLVYAIVGEDEADAAAGKISWCSPLARLLAEGRIGDEVLWKRPVGDIELRIAAIAPVAEE